MTDGGEHFEVAVRGGLLHARRWGTAGATVLALHGITGTQAAWLEVAPRLPGVTLLAPDLRGRGRSGGLDGPYGFNAHVDDLVALLDDAGLDRVIVAGHSMGAFVAVALAALHPDRVSSLVLVDGGLPLGRPDDPSPAGGIDAILGPAAERLAMTFPSRAAYHEFWKAHPSIGPMWGPSVAAYVDYDLEGEAPELRSSCSATAMRTDGAEVADHAGAAATLSRVTAPMTFLRAERGLLNEPPPFYPEGSLAQTLSESPPVAVSTVADSNHYSILLGEAGAAAVAAAILAATA